MMSATARFFVILHPLIILSLLLQECKSAMLAIHTSPASQVIILGETATLHCSGSGDEFQLNIQSATGFHIETEPHSNPEPGITVDIEKQDRVHTATVMIEGRASTNNTKIDCTVSNYSPPLVKISRTALLTVIGPPDAVFNLNFPEQLVNVQMKQFLAVWSVPFSHSNHSISSYNVSVDNINTTETYQRSITVSPGAKSPATENGTLDFPPSTSSCDILNVTLTAINDIGSSEPVSASLFIPAAPDMATSVTTAVLFYFDGTPLVTLEIKFPPLCWFEKLNYSVLLRHDGMESVVVEESVLNPPEYVMHNITAYVKAGTDYSIVVLAGTTVWNTVTDTHNFSTHLNLTTATVNASCPTSHLTLGVTLGTTAALLIVLSLIVCITVMAFSVRQRKTTTAITSITRSVEDLQVDNLPFSLSPNPIYDGPQYDTIRPPVRITGALSLNQPPIACGRSLYCESPTQTQVGHCNGLSLHQKEMDDCYIQMQTCKRQ